MVEFDTDPARVAARMAAPDPEDVYLAFIRARLAETPPWTAGPPAFMHEPLVRLVNWLDVELSGVIGELATTNYEDGLALLAAVAALWRWHPGYAAVVAEVERVEGL